MDGAAAKRLASFKSMLAAARERLALDIGFVLWDGSTVPDGLAADAFSTGATAPDAIRIALGAIPERARLAEALGLLAGLISDSE